jgi:hypothetical protein
LAINVFLSVGGTATEPHRRFVAAIEQVLRQSGFLPRTVRGIAGTPLPAIAHEMRRCAGTAVIALERVHAPAAVEFRGARRQQFIDGLSLPSVWTQVEAALAHSLGHPLLVVAERGLRREGLLATDHGWPVEELDLFAPEIDGRAFQEAFAAWAARVRANHSARAWFSPDRVGGTGTPLESRCAK